MRFPIASFCLPKHIFTSIFLWLLIPFFSHAQPKNLLLNGDFEDINNCSEYHSQCGVEAWFYMNAVQVQLQRFEKESALLGNNTLTIYYNWTNYGGFFPVFGTLLPCRLQAGTEYTFRGVFTAKFNSMLHFRPGIAVGERFYVPQRPFNQTLMVDSIMNIGPIDGSEFYQFEYSFTANGNEKYLTFGSFISEDLANGKRIQAGKKEYISLTVDHFELVSANANETVCDDYEANKNNIYHYDFRHKTMDYALYGKGELPIPTSDSGNGSATKIAMPPMKAFVKEAPSDTILLGDVLFDFNQSNLKPTAITLLQKVFKNASAVTIDSIFVEGHTDAVGSEAQNLLLSKQRSQSVKNWLVQNAILTDDKLQVHAFGKTRPVATNATAKGRATNRRVELIIFRK